MAHAQNLIGAVIDGRYRVDAKLGEGGFGAVYRATHLAMGTPLALKVLHAAADNEAATQRFQLEAKRSAALGHPHCITVFDFGRVAEEAGGGFYLAMELLDGRSLADVVRADGALEPARVRHILDQILDALAAAHAKGLVHRDLKPDNIFLVRAGETSDFVKVLDFGIAKAIDAGGDESAHLTASGSILGTPAYMAPEQCRGEAVDARTDLYALGCVAFALLAGSPPFKRDSLHGYLLAHTMEPAPDLAKIEGVAVPRDLAAWVARCLEKEPGGRFASAAVARAALASGGAVVPERPPRGRRALALALGLGAAGAVAAALVLALGGSGASSGGTGADAGAVLVAAAPDAATASPGAARVEVDATTGPATDAVAASAPDDAAVVEPDATGASRDATPPARDATAAPQDASPPTVGARPLRAAEVKPVAVPSGARPRVVTPTVPVSFDDGIIAGDTQDWPTREALIARVRPPLEAAARAAAKFLATQDHAPTLRELHIIGQIPSELDDWGERLTLTTAPATAGHVTVTVCSKGQPRQDAPPETRGPICASAVATLPAPPAP